MKDEWTCSNVRNGWAILGRLVLAALSLAGCVGPAFSSSPDAGQSSGAGGAPSFGGRTMLGGSNAVAGSIASNAVAGSIAAGSGTAGGGVAGSTGAGGAAQSPLVSPGVGGEPDGGGAAGAASGGAPIADPQVVVPVLDYADVDDAELRGNVPANATILRDRCPAGSVLVGVNAEINQNLIGQLQGICGIPGFSSARPDQLSIEPGATLEWEGGVSGTAVTALCPPDEVVVGFAGRSGLLLDQLQLRCAALLVSDGIVSVGVVHVIDPIGGDGGSSFARADCAAGTIADGVNVSVDYWLNGFGLACTRI